MPQPRLAPKKISEPSFCSDVSWLVVISSTDGRDRMRSLPNRPPFNIICAKALKSSAVDTSPALPFSKTGGVENLPVAGSSKTFSFEDFQFLRRLVAGIAGGEPIKLGLRHAERRVFHPQRREDALA